MVEPLVIPFVVVVRDELAHGRPEERVAVMDEDPDVSQESVLGIGGVPHELGDPRPVGLGADARDLNAAAGQVNQDQHGDAGQAAWRPDLDREEVGGGEHVPVGREKLPPGRARLAFGGGFEAALLAHVGDGAPRDLMTEVAAGTPNTGVAPLAVLGGHPDDEPADRVHDPWAARSATAAAVVCPRDQLSMPAALGVGDPETARTELLSEDAILFLERVNDVTRLLVDPARDGHDEELQHLGKRRHTGRAEQRLSAVTNGATRRASSVESARRTASIGFLDSTPTPSLTLDCGAGELGTTARRTIALVKALGRRPWEQASGYHRQRGDNGGTAHQRVRWGRPGCITP